LGHRKAPKFSQANGGLADIAGKLGLGTTDPSRMNADDAARLMNYARTEHPALVGEFKKDTA
jgi:hypothetical protein